MLFFSIIELGVLMALVSCRYKDVLGKVTMQMTQQFLVFLCFRKNPVKRSACAVARKFETYCFSRNLPISNDPVVRIPRNLTNNSSETLRMNYHKKSEFRHSELSILQNMQWNRCQNYIRAVFTERISWQLVVGKWWKKSNDWISFK